MLKKFLMAFWAAFACLLSTYALALDVNRASAAELDGIKGIGPAISERIVQERQKQPFKNWDDFIERVQGVGEKTASKFSEEGLTVNGQGYQGHVPVATTRNNTTQDKKSTTRTSKDNNAPVMGTTDTMTSNASTSTTGSEKKTKGKKSEDQKSEDKKSAEKKSVEKKSTEKESEGKKSGSKKSENKSESKKEQGKSASQ